MNSGEIDRNVSEAMLGVSSRRGWLRLANVSLWLSALGPILFAVVLLTANRYTSLSLPDRFWKALAQIMLFAPLCGMLLGLGMVARGSVRVTHPSAAASGGAGFILGLASLIFIPLLLPGMQTLRHPPARLTSCISDLKQLGLGMQMYVQDYDDRYPPSNTWTTVTLPYIKYRAVYRCPDEENHTLPSYAMNRFLAWGEKASLAAPDKTILLFDSLPRENATGAEELFPKPLRHNGLLVFAYADSHAKVTDTKGKPLFQWLPMVPGKDKP